MAENRDPTPKQLQIVQASGHSAAHLGRDYRSLPYSVSHDSVKHRPAADRWRKYRAHDKGELKSEILRFSSGQW